MLERGVKEDSEAETSERDSSLSKLQLYTWDTVCASLLTTWRKLFFSKPAFFQHFPGEEKTILRARFEGNIIPVVEDSGVTGTVCYGMDCKLLL